ncbi:class I SAM-dependent methyltransferase [Roseovarius aestuarii]|nr:class I SAM-dependent methyltransferase [Roseovarius aestuarii]
MSVQNRGAYALERCRACKGPLVSFLDLGESPIANQLLKTPHEHAASYPLGLSRCSQCTLVQNTTSLPKELLFGADYAYMSSVSSAVRTNAQDLARMVSRRIKSNATVLDVGSNDGTLQRAFRDEGVPCIGVDPSDIPVNHARETGVTSYCCSFDKSVAETLTQEYGQFAAVTMSNVLAHVAEPLHMLQAARRSLDPEAGVLVIEVQAWNDLVQLGAFDMVYHEHHSHFSLGSVAQLLKAAEFSIFDVQTTQAQGGSLRLWCRPSGEHAVVVKAMIEQEEEQLLGDEAVLNLALQKCRESASEFTKTMGGRNVAGYGAAAKTVTLLAALQSDLGIKLVADKAQTKVGKFLPVSAIPIVTPKQMLESGADVILVFAWNLATEILPEMEGRETWVPFPEFRRLQ